MDKIKILISKLQKEGIPLIFVRDPIRKLPSVSLTLLLISFIVSLFSLINKFAKIVEGVDVDNSLELLIICASLYFGRSLSSKMRK
jgi:hypothetical protein